MRLRHTLIALGCGLLLLQAAQPAAAQNAVTLYGGWRGGGSFQQVDSDASADVDASGAGALSIDWALDGARNVQLFASGQRTQLALTPASAGAPSSVSMRIGYLHLGGSNYVEGFVGQGLYVAGGLGATYFSPSLDGLSAELRPSMSLALGFDQPLTNALALRMELRGYITLINSSGGFFCSGGCVVSLRGDAFYQGEALLGLSLRF
ncbi:hypothetical protein [Rivibacter subsaxonicus]|uniref:Outer membrane protein with beta-barrel domain n=1 Tax=Rivibacter subsaxonicus TaxID=457575 RepID=A0A4Q7W038_9BURK|nr:hypothetical protein [Rivibacter subsaxonicus]RZU02155.1 hypothetical protein EV670_0174 [Rivibacter subsaxonicus]